MYKFSLIMATLGRKKEVENFMNSLKKQTYNNFELIIVDQNENNYIAHLYNEYSKYYTIKYVHIDKKGLSLARNVGLKYASGDIIAFPDDDCEYDKDILDEVNTFFTNNLNYNILTCNLLDKDLNKQSNGKWPHKDKDLNTINIFKTGISCTIFIKKVNMEDINFDEKLGVGAYLGSGEETDMLLQLIHNKYKGRYVHNLHVYHDDQKELDNIKIYNYSLGFGAVIKKELAYRKNYFYVNKLLINILIKPIIGIILYTILFNRNKRLTYINKLNGRLQGFIKYNYEITYL